MKNLMEYHIERAEYYKDLSQYFRHKDCKKSRRFYGRYKYHSAECDECRKIQQIHRLKIKQNEQDIPPSVRRLMETTDLKTDFTIHSVPLTDLHYLQEKDKVTALYNPVFISVDEARYWLDPKEPVIVVPTGLEDYGKAYPIRVLMWHEIVNDFILGEPIVVTYSPLCNSSYVFSRETDLDRVFTYGSSGLLRCSCTVMYDLATESLWDIMTGESMVGELTNWKLNPIPTNVVTFETFREMNPEGLVVLSAETGYIMRYGTNPYVGYDTAERPFFYRKEIDPRLPAMERVVGIRQDGMQRAYPYSVLQKNGVVEDEIEEDIYVIFYKEGMSSPLDTFVIKEGREIGATGVFKPFIDGIRYRFYRENNRIFDEETGSEWNLLGAAIAGPLEGKRLEWIVHIDPFWYAWAGCFPNTEVYR